MATLRTIINTLMEMAKTQKIQNLNSSSDILDMSVGYGEDCEIQPFPTFEICKDANNKMWLKLQRTGETKSLVEKQIELMERGVMFEPLNDIGIITPNGTNL